MLELINVIRILGVGYSEIVIDIDLEDFTINSIELDKDKNIIVHIFDGPLDVYMNFKDLKFEDQEKIKLTLKTFLYN